MVNEHSMLSMSRSTNRKASLKKPDDYFSSTGTRNKWYRQQSHVVLSDDLAGAQRYNTTNTDDFRMGLQTWSPPARAEKGSGRITMSSVELDDKETGNDVFHSHTKETHYNHGKLREKIIYPYRNASQIEMGKETLSYSLTNQELQQAALSKAKYGNPPGRTSRLRNKSKVVIGYGYQEEAPYIGGNLPVAINSLRKSTSNLTSSLRPMRKRLQNMADRPATAIVVGGMSGSSGQQKPAQEGEDPDECEDPDANDDQENAGADEDGEEQQQEDEGAEDGEADAEPYPIDDDVDEQEYTDYFHLDPLPQSAIPPNKISMMPSPQRVNISRGSVNKMASQISIGWTANPLKYVSHEHSSFKKLEVRKFVPLDHVRTKSQLPIKMLGEERDPEDYVSVTQDDFRDISDRIGSSTPVGSRIMGSKRGEHTLDYRRGKLDGKVDKSSKYSDDFSAMDTKRTAPKRVIRGEDGKTLSQLEMAKMAEGDSWEAAPLKMYETQAQRDFSAKPQQRIHSTPSDFRFRSQVSLMHPVRNKQNMMALYEQRSERQQAIQQDAETTHAGR